jgi:hypothetical protein
MMELHRYSSLFFLMLGPAIISVILIFNKAYR